MKQDFLKEIAKRSVKRDEQTMEAKCELIPTRRTLLDRLKDLEDQASWQEFFDTYWKLIYTTAIKSGLTDAEAEDVVQETVISVVRTIPRFDYDPTIGSFKTWLLNLTRWRITDQFRKRQPELDPPRGANDKTRTSTIERVPDPRGNWMEAFWDDEWEKNIVDVAIERVKQQVDPKQFQVFDLYVFKEWPVPKIAQTLGISAARIYLTKHRVARLIKKEIKALEKKHG